MPENPIWTEPFEGSFVAMFIRDFVAMFIREAPHLDTLKCTFAIALDGALSQAETKELLSTFGGFSSWSPEVKDALRKSLGADAFDRFKNDFSVVFHTIKPLGWPGRKAMEKGAWHDRMFRLESWDRRSEEARLQKEIQQVEEDLERRNRALRSFVCETLEFRKSKWCWPDIRQVDIVLEPDGGENVGNVEVTVTPEVDYPPSDYSVETEVSELGRISNTPEVLLTHIG